MTIRSCLEKFAKETPQATALRYYQAKEWQTRSWADFLLGVRVTKEKAALAEEKKQEYNNLFCNPYKAASYGYIDDVIEPRNTRFRVIRALESLAGKKVAQPLRKHDNMPL